MGCQTIKRGQKMCENKLSDDSRPFRVHLRPWSNIVLRCKRKFQISSVIRGRSKLHFVWPNFWLMPWFCWRFPAFSNYTGNCLFEYFLPIHQRTLNFLQKKFQSSILFTSVSFSRRFSHYWYFLAVYPFLPSKLFKTIKKRGGMDLFYGG